jgi:hypothetical protein
MPKTANSEPVQERSSSSRLMRKRALEDESALLQGSLISEPGIAEAAFSISSKEPAARAVRYWVFSGTMRINSGVEEGRARIFPRSAWFEEIEP